MLFQKYTKIVLTLKWPLLLFLLLITGLLGLSMLHLQIDPSMETLFVKSSPEYQYYKKYRETYGSDQIVAVAVATNNVFTEKNLNLLDNLTKKASKFPQVERVLSLTNAKDIRHKFMGVKIVPALKGLSDGSKTLDEIRSEILSNELYVGNLISTDGKVASLLIYLKPSSKTHASAGDFIEDIRKYLDSQETESVKFYMAGAPVEQYDFIRLIRRDQFTFVPMITLLLILATFLIYRSFSCMVLSMSIVFMTLVWTIGTIAVIGQELNLMTSLLAPVIMIIAVVNSIHLMNLYFEIRPSHASLREAVVLTIAGLGIPCLLTHVTTIFGFLSLAITPIPAIKSFGIFAALGTFYSYVVEMMLTAILLPMLPYRKPRDFSNSGQFFNRFLIGFLEHLEFRWKWIILGVTVLGVIGAVIGIRQIEVDTNIVKQMKSDLPLAISTRFIDEHLTGVYTLGFVLNRKDGQSMATEATLEKVDAFKHYLELKPEITKVNSITTLIKKINEARGGDKEDYEIPEEERSLDKYFKGISESNDPEVWKLISKDFREIRLEARMKAVGTRQGGLVEDEIRAFMQENLADEFEYHQTGNVVLLGRMAKDLVSQQLKSFAIAFASILFIIILIFRSLKMGLLACIPNLLPILGVYGIMGFMKIELSSTTAMISSIVLGMVVDASIHFLHRFQLEFSKRAHYLQALHHTFRNVGQALVVSTLILVIGFASSIFANFKPTIYFGAFTSLTILLALLCTLVVLPVCLIVLKPFGSQKLFRLRH